MCGIGETPGISVGDIAKTIGEMWRGLSDADKKPFQVCVDLEQIHSQCFDVAHCNWVLGRICYQGCGGRMCHQRRLRRQWFLQLPLTASLVCIHVHWQQAVQAILCLPVKGFATPIFTLFLQHAC